MYENNRTFLKKIDSLPTQGAEWKCDIITSKGNQMNDDGDLMPAEKLELWRRDPERHFADKEAKNQVYDEMWTADWWWNAQVC